MTHSHQVHRRGVSGVNAFADTTASRFGAEPAYTPPAPTTTEDPVVTPGYQVESGNGSVVGYVRRSAEDRRGRPLVTQMETIRRYVQEVLVPRAPPGTVDGVRAFYIDNGISGTTEPSLRPGMSRLLQDIKGLVRPHVVVYDATRVARAVETGIEFKRLLDCSGASLHLAQSRAVVEGSNQEMLFTINLQLAASERVAAITRIRSAFAQHPQWDPRRYGLQFSGAGSTAVDDPVACEVITQIRTWYETEGVSPTEIAKRLQIQTGGHPYRKIEVDHDASVASHTLVHKKNSRLIPWSTADVLRIIRYHKFQWKGERTLQTLKSEIAEAQSRGESISTFFASHRGLSYDGVRINRAMLRKQGFSEDMLPWKRRAFELTCAWVRSERYSVDDIAAMLNREVPRPGSTGWTRQTTWRLIAQARETVRQENEEAHHRELDHRRKRI